MMKKRFLVTILAVLEISTVLTGCRIKTRKNEEPKTEETKKIESELEDAEITEEELDAARKILAETECVGSDFTGKGLTGMKVIYKYDLDAEPEFEVVLGEALDNTIEMFYKQVSKKGMYPSALEVEYLDRNEKSIITRTITGKEAGIKLSEYVSYVSEIASKFTEESDDMRQRVLTEGDDKLVIQFCLKKDIGNYDMKSLREQMIMYFDMFKLELAQATIDCKSLVVSCLDCEGVELFRIDDKEQ